MPAQQILAGIQFIWLRDLDHLLFSRRNICTSRNGDINIGEIPIILLGSISNCCIFRSY
jgi:hypothetical protein